MNQAKLFEDINKSLEFYEIIPTNTCMGEEGKMIEATETVGYAVVNKITQVVEHTSTILAGVFFQAQHFDNTLKSLLVDEEGPAADSGDDVIPMLQ